MFVRIRPNMTGFREEVGAGVREGMSGLAKVAGVAFGAVEAFKFGKDIIEHAGEVQKQVEAIKDLFGEASQSVLDFGDKGAAALGISAHESETTATRFGLLFKQLGIGPKKAAEMTIGFEKLAGSIALIRGKDPAEFLKNLPLAVAGNLRSLKQLGIAVDANTLKAAAFKAGIISNINQALTPGQRALAIYQVAMAHLPELLALVAKHSGDAANKAATLAAQWDNAKDALGKGLLPATRIVEQVFITVIPGAVKVTQAVFRALAAGVVALAHAFAPAFGGIAREVGRVRAAFSSGGLGGAIQKLRDDFNKLTPAGKGAVIIIGGIAAAFAAMAISAAPFTIATVAILGLAVAFRHAYDSSARFRAIVQQVQSFVQTRVGPAFHAAADAVGRAFEKVAPHVRSTLHSVIAVVRAVATGVLAVWHRIGGTLTTITRNAFGQIATVVKTSFKVIDAVFSAVSAVFRGQWSTAWHNLVKIPRAVLGGVVELVRGFGKTLGQVFSNVWQAVEKVVLQGVSAALKPLAAIRTSFTVFGHKVGFENPFKKVRESIGDAIKGLDAAKEAKGFADAIAKNTASALKVKNTDPAMTMAATSVAKHVNKTIKRGLEKPDSEDKVTAAPAVVDSAIKQTRQAISDLKGKLREAVTQMKTDVQQSVTDAKANLITIGSSLADSVGQIMDAPFKIASDRISAAQNRLSLTFDRKNAVLAGQARKLSAEQAKLGLAGDESALEKLRGSALLPGGHALSKDPLTAIKQLKDLAAHSKSNRPAIEAFLRQYQAAFLQVRQDKLGIRQSKLDSQRTVAETRLNLKGAALRVAQDVSNSLKESTQRQIADLTASLASHGINLRTFNKKLAALLAADHVSYKKAGHLLGSAFASGFRAQTKGIIAQAKALAEGPQEPGTGQEPKIVHPLDVLHRDQQRIHTLQRQIGNKQIQLQARIAKAAEKSAALQARLNAVQIADDGKPKNRNPGSQSKKSKELTNTT